MKRFLIRCSIEYSHPWDVGQGREGLNIDDRFNCEVTIGLRLLTVNATVCLSHKLDQMSYLSTFTSLLEFTPNFIVPRMILVELVYTLEYGAIRNVGSSTEKCTRV